LPSNSPKELFPKGFFLKGVCVNPDKAVDKTPKYQRKGITSKNGLPVKTMLYL
jgi:hypothetical protein